MYTTTSLFPDVNVWLALAHPISPHHRHAIRWASSIELSIPVYFCRVTQLALLRILTTAAAMGQDVMTQSQAWKSYDVFLTNPNVSLLDEPARLDELFRRRSTRGETSPKQWADAYLAAFAEGHGLTLVTFDKALAKAAKSSILLQYTDLP